MTYCWNVPGHCCCCCCCHLNGSAFQDLATFFCPPPPLLFLPSPFCTEYPFFVPQTEEETYIIPRDLLVETSAVVPRQTRRCRWYEPISPSSHENMAYVKTLARGYMLAHLRQFPQICAIHLMPTLSPTFTAELSVPGPILTTMPTPS